jgi:tRNA threonylcarbamoyladenosine biosynthesis protein TsaB
VILAIETATEVCSTALIHEGKLLSQRSVNEKNIHSEQLMMLIDEMIRESNISKKNLDAVAVSIGPGSFTGLRIGLSSAKGIACALGTPIIAVPTLDGIAEEYRLKRTSTGDEIFCSFIDAKRNESFYCYYAVTQHDTVRLSEYAIKAKEEILRECEVKKAIVLRQPCNASAVAHLAERKKNELIVDDFSQLEPLYLRDFVVTPSKK